MAVLTEGEIKKIVHRATLLQNLADSSKGPYDEEYSESLDGLFEITDSLNIKRQFVQEAFIEYSGAPVQDPIIVDNLNPNAAEVIGFTNNGLDSGTINEFKSILEYHFNSNGKAVRRKNKILWRAKPKGITKIFSIVNSPEAEIDFSESLLKVSVRQNLKTLNKFYYPPILLSIGFFLAAVGEGGADADQFVVASFVMAGIAFTISQLVKRRQRKTKKKLVELMETLQQVFERRFLSKKRAQNAAATEERIQIPEDEYTKGNNPSNLNEVME